MRCNYRALVAAVVLLAMLAGAAYAQSLGLGFGLDNLRGKGSGTGVPVVVSGTILITAPSTHFITAPGTILVIQ